MYNSSIPNWLEWTLIAEFPLGFLLLIKRFPLIVRVIITAPTLLTALFLALNYCFSGDTTTVYEATFENTQIEYHRSGLHRSKKYLARYASENGFTIERPLSKHDYDHDIYPPKIQFEVQNGLFGYPVMHQRASMSERVALFVFYLDILWLIAVCCFSARNKDFSLTKSWCVVLPVCASCGLCYIYPSVLSTTVAILISLYAATAALYLMINYIFTRDTRYEYGTITSVQVEESDRSPSYEIKLSLDDGYTISWYASRDDYFRINEGDHIPVAISTGYFNMTVVKPA